MSNSVREMKLNCCFLLIILISVVLVLPDLIYSQSVGDEIGNQEELLESLKRATDRAPERFDALMQLSNLIDSKKIFYTPDNLNNYVLYMLKYYDREGDLDVFSRSIYKIINYGHLHVIESYFRDTERLGKEVDNLINIWKTPDSIEILESGRTIQLRHNSSKPLTIIVRNNIDSILQKEDYTLEANSRPKNLVSFSNGKIKSGDGCGNGALDIYIKSNSKISASVDFDVHGCNEPPPPEPDSVKITGVKPICGFPGTKVEIEGENFDTLAESNTIKFGNAEAKTISVEAGRLNTKVPQNALIGKLPVTVTTSVNMATWNSTFEVKNLPVAPSKQWPLVSGGAFAVSGVAFLIYAKKASDKYDTYIENLPHDQSLYDDYKSANTIKKWSGGIAIVSGVVSGYLWYKYYKSHKEYKKKLNKPCITTGIIWDDDYVGLAASYNF